MFVLRRIGCTSVLMFGVSSASVMAQPTGIIINDQPLAMQQAAAYGIQLAPGRYWYDPISGLWGLQGQGYLVQAQPAMPIGGPLRADASNGNTKVFVNGREIVRAELEALQAVCVVSPPARYWLSHDLLAGPVGGPASCNLDESNGNRPSDPNDLCHNPQFWEDKIHCMTMGYNYPD